IHIEHVLHLLRLLRQPPSLVRPSPNRAALRQLYAEEGPSLRHVGAFYALLCPDVPDAVEADAVREICERLRRRDVTIYGFLLEEANPPVSVMPAWTPDELEVRVFEEFSRFTHEEVRSWLKHGRGPVRKAAEALARAMPVKLSQTMTKLLD